MSKYMQHNDFNGQLVQEGINALKIVKVPLNANLTNFQVAIPENAYGVIFYYIPSSFTVDAKINGSEAITIRNSGATFSPFVELVQSLTLTTTATSAESLELLFII